MACLHAARLLEVGCFKSQRRILVKKILEGSTLLDHELTEVLTVSLLGVEFLLPINDAVSI